MKIFINYYEDIYKLSDNSLYLIRSKLNSKTTMLYIDEMNNKVKELGLNIKFIYMPEGMCFVQIKEK